MKVEPTSLPEVLRITPVVRADERGAFHEVWQLERYAEAGLPTAWVQDNVSVSQRDVLRGLHFQQPHAQGKLVSVIRGEILDVADWDRSVVTNVPGQSAQPGSPFYSNLLPLWDNAEYFPLVYSRPRVDREAAHKLLLRPVARPTSAQR